MKRKPKSPPPKPPAQIAYEAYRDVAGRKSLVTGAKLPPWDELPDKIQDAWHAAAISLATHYLATSAMQGMR